MLMAANRLNIPTIFVSGGPMESGKFDYRGVARRIDAIDTIYVAGDPDATQSEIDALGVLHPIITRGIERRKASARSRKAVVGYQKSKVRRQISESRVQGGKLIAAGCRSHMNLES